MEEPVCGVGLSEVAEDDPEQHPVHHVALRPVLGLLGRRTLGVGIEREQPMIHSQPEGRAVHTEGRYHVLGDWASYDLPPRKPAAPVPQRPDLAPGVVGLEARDSKDLGGPFGILDDPALSLNFLPDFHECELWVARVGCF